MRVVIVADAADPDGDAVSYQTLWFQDGSLRDDLTGDTLPSAETRKGQRWQARVVSSDGRAEGGVAEAEATVVNSPPTATAALPPGVGALADLELVVGAEDVDGDAVSFAVTWAVDGEVTPWTDAVVPASETTRGEVWTATVTPNDGEQDGPAVVATVRIDNTAPTVGELDLNPAVLYTNDTWTATTVGADADGDPVTLSYAWTVNGSTVGATGSSLSGALYFDKGDVVQLTVTPSDGLTDGSSRSSSALTVQNSAPTAPVVRVSPTAPAEGEALVCGVLTEANDPDGDLLSYSVAWTVEGVPYTDVEDGVLLGDTVPAGATFADEVWTCAVTANDGTVSGPAAEDGVLVQTGVCGDGRVTLRASGIELVTVCGGTFDMGCTPGQSSCASDESPVTTTTLTRDYYIGRAEVTQGQFQAVMGYNPSTLSTCGSSCPVETLTWHEAAAFANAVSAASGLANCYTCTGSGSTVTCAAPLDPYACEGYRLPTEAEWEGAARCGTDLLYAGSDIIDTVAWHTTNSGASPHPVGLLTPNDCGLYDTSGNVWEWTNDWYGAYGGSSAIDPRGPALGGARVLRGGSWINVQRLVRVATRGSFPPEGSTNLWGVRLVRTAP